MKVYDIALALIRTLVALDLIRQAGDLVFAAFRTGLDLSSADHLRPTELAAIMSAGFSIIVLLIVWAVARPIARFASKYAPA
jgi:hypothetical protein